jgi:Spy/CpxP family protein refolding chaperone
MKTLLRLTLVAGVLAVTGLALTPTFAQDGPAQGGAPMRRMGPGGPGGPGFGPGGPGDIGLPLRELELTDAQREQVRTVMQSNQAAFKEISDRMRTARAALDAVVTADTVDEASIRAKSAEVAAVEADGAVLRAKVHQEVFGLLTAEQQAKAKELRAQRQQKMQQRADRIRERGAERRERRNRAALQG